MDDRFRIEFFEMEEDGDKQWIWDFRKQALFASDKGTRQLQLLLYSPHREENRYFRTVKYKNKLIVIPVKAEDVLIYDVVTNICVKLPLPTGIWNEDSQKKGKFGRGIINGKYLILLPLWSNVICKIDMEQERIITIKDVSQLEITTDGNLPYGKAILENGYIYVVASEDPALIVVNVDTLECSKKIFSDYLKGFCSIVRQNEYFWLFPRYAGDIIKWNPDTDKEERYSIPRALLPSNDRVGFLSAKRIGDSVWLFPETAPEVLRVDMETGKVEIEEAFREYSAYRNEEHTYVKYWMTKTEGAVLQAYSAVKGVLVQYDTEKKDISELPYYLSGENRIGYYIESDFIAGKILEENMTFKLSDYLMIISGSDLSLGK